MSSLEQFQTFYQAYIAAVDQGDEAFMRGIMPPTIEADHLGFVMEFSKGFYGQVAASGIEPEYIADGNRMVVRYVMESEEGRDTLDREFWFSDGRWLSYDPEDADG